MSYQINSYRMLISLKRITCLVILGLIAICGGCSVLSIDPRLFYTTEKYQLHINCNKTLSNATFYIPLPVKNGIPSTGKLNLTPEMFEKENFSVEFIKFPPEMIEGGFSPPNNPPLWLKIHSDVISPNSSRPEYFIEITERTKQTSPRTYSDTVHPLETQSVFIPKFSFLPPQVSEIKSVESYHTQYAPIKISQKIPIYAEFSASPTAEVEVFSTIRVSNSWLEKYDEYKGNDYDDMFDWKHRGPSRGWQLAEGEFIAAEGIYPNLLDPVWQKVLNETS